MKKIVTIIGARPQIIKAAALSRAINKSFPNQLEEIIVHTGQHYDDNMSNVFFEELNIPKPKYNLNVGSASHAAQTSAMIIGIEEILQKEKPNAIVLYGDTNSTLAGAIAAAKIHVPIVHIEAGLRSYNKKMPEEINRILCDHASTLLFSPTITGYENLTKEGFKKDNTAPFTADNPKIYHCGDVMYDNSLHFSEISETKTDILHQYNLKQNEFILATIHRDNNTDIPARLNSLFEALNEISLENELKVILPLHPRTAKLLLTTLNPELYSEVKKNTNFILTQPASFLEMIALEKNAKLVITDSGGVQKEAFYFNKPCIILRPETEWIELVNCGAAVIADANKTKIKTAFAKFKDLQEWKHHNYYGDGNAAEFIANEIITHL